VTRVLIADDEPHLCRYLGSQLAALWHSIMPGQLALCVPAHDGPEALQRIGQEQPALVFLDVRMPGMSGLDVARQLLQRHQGGDRPPLPLVVFVTAYEEHAVSAFEAAAVDYLLKPVEPARLEQCLQRLAPRLGEPGAQRTERQRKESLQAAIADAGTGAAVRSLRWLRAGRGEEVQLVAVEEVLFFRAEHKYVTACTRDREHVLRLSLRELVEQLDPEQFWQIHRSVLVNVSAIASARRELGGRYLITLKDSEETLRASRAYAWRFQAM
jgi:DNA-binding LytR/AlgR family response regulator